MVRDVGKAVARTLNLASASRRCFDAAMLCGVFGALALTTEGERLVGLGVLVIAALFGGVGVVLQIAAGRQL